VTLCWTLRCNSPRDRRLSTSAIYRLKGTPASLLGHVEAPDAETAIKKAIDEFAIEPALHKRLLAQRRA